MNKESNNRRTFLQQGMLLRNRTCILFWILPLLLAVAIPGSAQTNSTRVDPKLDRSAQTAAIPAVFKGTVPHMSAKEIVLVYDNQRQTTVLDSDGAFTFSLQLEAPGYAELEFRSIKDKRLKVFLLPGQTLVLTCDVSDLYGTARFTGAGAAENNGLALLQAQYGQIDGRRLIGANAADFPAFLQFERMKLEKTLADYAQGHPGLDPGFQRLERTRIAYWEALVRIEKTKYTGNGGWEEYVSKLDFNVNDPSLLDIESYALFLYQYICAKASERIASDPALKASINQQTEARYTVAVETITNPTVRNWVLHKILLIHFADPSQEEGPLGCKGMDGLMARFDRDCTDNSFREDIDRLYQECQAGRNAPVIRSYKTVGTTTLDAHIFPASGAKPGQKRPAFLFFHGGAWRFGMPEWGYGDCRYYADRGLVGISFEYRIRQRHGTTIIESVADAKSAVRWVRVHANELGIDPDRIVAAGFSAGGHLAAVAGMAPGCDNPGDDKTVSAVPNALVLMSTPLDLMSDDVPGRDPADFSPAYHVRPGLPSTIVFHGLEDRFCPFAKIKAFCNNLKVAGDRCELHTFKGGHFRSGADWTFIRKKTDEFLTSLGLLDASPNI